MSRTRSFVPALAVLCVAAAAQAQTATPPAAPAAAASAAPAAAPPDPQSLALAERIIAPAAPILEGALAQACSGADMIGRAKDLPPEQRAKAIAAAQPICLRAVGLVKGAFVQAAAQAFPRDDLQAIYDFTRSPEVAGVLVQIAASGPKPNPTDAQKAALKADLERFMATPAGQDVKAHGKAFVGRLQADLLPQIMALKTQAESAACAAASCPAS